MTIKQQKGSFLLEFLIALGIFSIAIVGLVKLQNRATADLSDLGSDMAIPILIDDFTARINIAPNNVIDNRSWNELKVTANVMMKDIEKGEDKNTIRIIDMIDPSKKNDYTVVIDLNGI
ncbi:type IV pilus modification PilV family protein [Wohlfahrtiimonas larvae]|uniref:Type II secretion system protein n=1 Tax=Wohlfahrtiimonas larvae TaxID=1157986 RepID=A0ABP9MW43_9GAMM|nr:hypothetical protein [Wohlfahrtiimonas larvae]